jgi:Amt family ammonium transporter
MRLKSRSSIDDTLDVSLLPRDGRHPGMILTGLFAEEVGLIHGDPTNFPVSPEALCYVRSLLLLAAHFCCNKLTEPDSSDACN